MDIKFRFWNHIYNEMLYDDVFYYDKKNGFHAVVLNKKNGRFIMLKKAMQYIWEKDKNKKDIYVGDIITDGINNYTVGYSESDCSFVFYNDSMTMFFRKYFSDIEIIGNIYKNKTLLNDFYKRMLKQKKDWFANNNEKI
jgi:hypothetical protein